MAFSALVVGLLHDLRPDLWTSRQRRRQRRRERAQAPIPAVLAPAPPVRMAAPTPAHHRASPSANLADPDVEPVRGTAVDGSLTASVAVPRPVREAASVAVPRPVREAASVAVPRPVREAASVTPVEALGSAPSVQPRSDPAYVGAGLTALLERSAPAPATGRTPRERLHFQERFDPELRSTLPAAAVRPSQTPRPVALDARPAQTAAAPRLDDRSSRPANTPVPAPRRHTIAIVAGCAVAAWIIFS
jgi:hypothetical protein